MARRPRLLAPGILYHVIVRGNQRQKTFLRDSDYQAYLERLSRYRKRWGVTVYAYCLMPNHVHLVETGSNRCPGSCQDCNNLIHNTLIVSMAKWAICFRGATKPLCAR